MVGPFNLAEGDLVGKRPPPTPVWDRIASRSCREKNPLAKEERNLLSREENLFLSKGGGLFWFDRMDMLLSR